MVTSTARHTIRYAKSNREVVIGDRVKVRMYFLFWRRGRIVYVPGVSPPNSELEYNGYCHVGVWFWKGNFGGYEVDPKNLTVFKHVKFERRDDSVAPKWPPPGSWQ
jgi:hypothetical protein